MTPWRFTLLMLLVCLHLRGEQETTVSFEISATELTIYDTLSVKLTLTYPNGYHVDTSALRRNLYDTASFTLVGEELGIPEVASDGYVQQSILYSLDPWKPGRHAITFGVVTFFPDDLSKTSVKILSDIVSVKIVLPEEDSSLENFTILLLPLPGTPAFGLDEATKQILSCHGDYRPGLAIKNQKTFARHSFPWRWTLVTIVILTALWLTRERIKEAIARWQRQREAIADPRNRALKALHQLEENHLPEAGFFEEFYVSITNVVRTFVEDIYDIKAPEQTTEEFLQAMTSSHLFDKDSQHRLKDFLYYADLVKFARHRPTIEDCAQAMNAARDFISS